MDWESIITILPAILIAIGLPLVLRKRRKTGPLKMEGLYDHFRGLGVDASLLEGGEAEEQIAMMRSRTEKSLGILEIKGRKIDYIDVVGMSSQYGTNYFLDYLVKRPDLLIKGPQKKTTLVKKKTSALWGKVIDIK